MKKRLFALFRYSVFWLALFLFARLLFILFQYQNSSHEKLTGLLASFLHGSKLDISTTGYYLLVPFLLMIPSLYFSGKWYRLIIRGYSYLLIIFTAIIVVADANLYTYWGFRMDYTPFFYLKTPGEAMASVSTFQLIVLFVLTAAIASSFIILFRKFIDRSFGNFEKVSLLKGVPVFLFLTGALIIPIRGGFGIAPINAGTVYFSNRMFLNHAAVNAVWNVGTSAVTRKPVKNPYNFTDKSGALATFDSLYINKKEEARIKVLNTTHPNILIIILESFSGYLIGPLGGDSLVTPCINRYAREGILFTRFYASGTRTDKALPAILSGYPAQPAQSIIKEPRKSQSLPGLVRILSDHGYNSSFWYGGDINFANFNSFIIGSGFRNITTKDDFDPDSYNAKWGVHDHIIFDSFRKYMKNPEQPFFNVLLTLSSHEPFDIPVKPEFSGSDMMTRYKNAVYYTDKTLGAFLDWARSTDWWKNTLVILVADHCARIDPETPSSAREVFRIPMLWTGGALAVTGREINKLGDQADMATTLMNQLGIKGDFPFSKDLLSAESKSFAFYTFNEGFGFITDSSSVEYDQKSGGVVRAEGKKPEAAEAKGKAYLQVLFDDYLKR